MTAFAYFCGSAFDDQARRLEEREQVRAFYESKGLPYDPALGLFQDRPASKRRSFKQREVGFALADRVRGGDHVCFPRSELAFRSLAEFAAVIERFQKQGVTVHLLNFSGTPIDTATLQGKIFVRTLWALAEFERQRKNEVFREAFKLRRSSGAMKRTARKVPMGFRRRGGKLVPTHDLKVMRAIHRWSTQDPPTSCEAIWMHLVRHRMPCEKSRTHGLWSERQVERAAKRYAQHLQDGTLNGIDIDALQPIGKDAWKKRRRKRRKADLGAFSFLESESQQHRAQEAGQTGLRGRVLV